VRRARRETERRHGRGVVGERDHGRAHGAARRPHLADAVVAGHRRLAVGREPLEAGEERAEALALARDALLRDGERVEAVEVREDVRPDRERRPLPFAAAVDEDLRLPAVEEQQVERVVAGPGEVSVEPSPRFRDGPPLEDVDHEAAATAEPRDGSGSRAVRDRRDEAVRVDADPGAARLEVARRHDPRGAGPQGRRRERPVVRLVAVREEDDRRVAPHAVVDEEHAHGAPILTRRRRPRAPYSVKPPSPRRRAALPCRGGPPRGRSRRP
jgi:hypothetical protein